MRENRTSGICGGALETGSAEMATDLSTAWETARDMRGSPSSVVLPRQRPTRLVAQSVGNSDWEVVPRD